MAKCVYCGCEITDDRAVDICDKCGIQVFSENMFNAIKKNMADAKIRGDLNQGLVSNPEVPEKLEY